METQQMSVMDQLMGTLGKGAAIYSQVTLAKKGVATPVQVETSGANAPITKVGSPANVKAGEDFISKIADSASKAYTADRLHKSLPMIVGAIVGVIALGALIYGLRK